MNSAAAAAVRDRDQYGNRMMTNGSTRHRALERLYERRAAVDQLIEALERYQQGRGQKQIEALTVVGKSS